MSKKSRWINHTGGGVLYSCLGIWVPPRVLNPDPVSDKNTQKKKPYPVKDDSLHLKILFRARDKIHTLRLYKNLNCLAMPFTSEKSCSMRLKCREKYLWIVYLYHGDDPCLWDACATQRHLFHHVIQDKETRQPVRSVLSILILIGGKYNLN